MVEMVNTVNMDYFELVKPLRMGKVFSIEVDYDDDTIIPLYAWLKYNQDICFDGISLSLCINKYT